MPRTPVGQPSEMAAFARHGRVYVDDFEIDVEDDIAHLLHPRYRNPIGDRAGVFATGSVSYLFRICSTCPQPTGVLDSQSAGGRGSIGPAVVAGLGDWFDAAPKPARMLVATA